MDPHEEFYQTTPKRPRSELDQDSLSPRHGLIRRHRPKQPQRHPHTIAHKPITKLGDLTGNPTYFLEMRSFEARKMDTLYPERQFKERGGE